MIPQASELPDVPAWDALAQDFEAFHTRFASLFARSEPRNEALKYIRALMGAAARRNGWQLAEAIGDRCWRPLLKRRLRPFSRTLPDGNPTSARGWPSRIMSARAHV